MSRPASLLCAVTAIACAASACSSTSRTSGTAAVVGGTAAAIAGGALLVALDSSDEGDSGGISDGDVACVLGGCVLAGMLVVLGLATASIGIVALSRDGARSPAPPPAPPPPTSPPAEAAQVDVRLLTSLPAMPTDAETLRLARQARAAARRGDCDTARVTARRIAARDQRYAAALIGSAVLARCR